MSLLKSLQSAGTIKSSTVKDSEYLNEGELIRTNIPIIDIAFSGRVDGGFVNGLTIISGESKTYKTMLGLLCMKAFMSKHPDGVVLFYDSEFGSPQSYFNKYKMDLERIVHIPVTEIEQLKIDLKKRLDQIKRSDKVFVFVDSIGNLASNKEVEDAENEKIVADMTRAKAMKSLFRIITPHLTMKDIPCFMINHVYKSMDLYSKPIVSGGSGVIYSANQVFIITKAQEKDKSGELSGHKFTINVEKSRYVKERSKFPFIVSYDTGSAKWSGLFDMAMDAGMITSPKQGWYKTDDTETNKRRKDIECDDAYWVDLLKNPEFQEYVKKKYWLEHEMNEAIEE